MNEAQTLSTLTITAVLLGSFHTMIGPDHYLPFVALSKARGWKLTKTLWITLACGIAHVMSSVVIGLAGIALGASVGMLENIEGQRADVVKWLLLIFAAAYTLYGIKRAVSGKAHTHGAMVHSHSHGGETHTHAHPVANTTHFWILFIIFAFGPCEVLIPLVMVPAVDFNWMGVVWVSLAFAAATLLTMLLMVSTLYCGASLIPFNGEKLQRWSHAMAGVVLMLCAGLMFSGL